MTQVIRFKKSFTIGLLMAVMGGLGLSETALAGKPYYKSMVKDGVRLSSSIYKNSRSHPYNVKSDNFNHVVMVANYRDRSNPKGLKHSRFNNQVDTGINRRANRHVGGKGDDRDHNKRSRNQVKHHGRSYSQRNHSQRNHSQRNQNKPFRNKHRGHIGAINLHIDNQRGRNKHFGYLRHNGLRLSYDYYNRHRHQSHFNRHRKGYSHSYHIGQSNYRHEGRQHPNVVNFYNTCSYGSRPVRLPIGEYRNTAYLADATQSFRSLMVPKGIEVVAYSGTNFSGEQRIYRHNVGCVAKRHLSHIGSIKVIALTAQAHSGVSHNGDHNVRYESDYDRNLGGSSYYRNESFGNDGFENDNDKSNNSYDDNFNSN